MQMEVVSWQGRAAIISYNILVAIACDRFFLLCLSSEIHIIFGYTVVIIEQPLINICFLRDTLVSMILII